MPKGRDEQGEKTVYEIGYLVLPSIPEDKISKVTDAMRKVIAGEGGVEIAAEEPFLEPLAYSMSKTVGTNRYLVSEAYIGWIKFEALGLEAQEIKVGIEKIDEVLRFLMTKAPRETYFTFAKEREARKIPVPEETAGESVPVPTESAIVENVLQ